MAQREKDANTSPGFSVPGIKVGHKVRIKSSVPGRQVGIVSTGFEDFKTKAKEKLGLRHDVAVVLSLAEDGTEVLDQEYFDSLPPQTVFLVSPKDSGCIIM